MRSRTRGFPLTKAEEYFDELRQQDARLRQTLIESSKRFGLVVIGYSGRDRSVMDTFERAVATPGAFPAGLFWLHYGDWSDTCRHEPAGQACESDVDTALGFDEVRVTLVRISKNLDTAALDSFATTRRVWSGAPIPRGQLGWPVIRLNALPVVQAPNICTRVVCQIGGTKEVRCAVSEAGVNVIAVRSQSGVLAFGSDSDVRSAFDPYAITDFDVHTLDPRRQRYDSTERGLLVEALGVALKRQTGLKMSKRRDEYLLAPDDLAASTWLPLKGLVGTLSGTVKGHPELHWREGVGIRLAWADDRLWVLVEPRTVFDGINYDNRFAASDFSRERTFNRYNRVINDLLEFWSKQLAQGGQELRALGVGDGIDAVFRLSTITGFSRRVGA